MNTKARQSMYEAITRHGESLLIAFPNATVRDPVALAKALRRIETKVYAPILQACNGNDITEAEVDTACDKARAGVRKLLGLTAEQAASGGLLVINHDPRGHSLKLREEWVKAHNATQYAAKSGRAVYTDWGGYGILAPDFTPDA